MDPSAPATVAQVFATFIVALAFSRPPASESRLVVWVLRLSRVFATAGLIGGIIRMLLHMSGSYPLTSESRLTYWIVLGMLPAAILLIFNVAAMDDGSFLWKTAKKKKKKKEKKSS